MRNGVGVEGYEFGLFLFISCLELMFFEGILCGVIFRVIIFGVVGVGIFELGVIIGFFCGDYDGGKGGVFGFCMDE